MADKKKISWLTHLHSVILLSCLSCSTQTLMNAWTSGFAVISATTPKAPTCALVPRTSRRLIICARLKVPEMALGGELYLIRSAASLVCIREISWWWVGLNEIWTDWYRITSFAYSFLRVFLNVKKQQNPKIFVSRDIVKLILLFKKEMSRDLFQFNVAF